MSFPVLFLQGIIPFVIFVKVYRLRSGRSALAGIVDEVQTFLVAAHDSLTHAKHGLIIQLCGIFTIFAAAFYFFAKQHSNDLPGLFSVLYMIFLKNAIVFCKITAKNIISGGIKGDNIVILLCNSTPPVRNASMQLIGVCISFPRIYGSMLRSLITDFVCKITHIPPKESAPEQMINLASSFLIDPKLMIPVLSSSAHWTMEEMIGGSMNSSHRSMNAAMIRNSMIHPQMLPIVFTADCTVS